jgi:riboflavin-specific deaminase-like protein
MLPYILLSYAQSIDGQIATASGDSQWISGEQSLRFTHELRNQYDAILVGSGTVEKDDPQLTTRLPYPGKNPLRIVLDPKLKLSSEKKVFLNTSEAPSMVFYSETLKESEAVDFKEKHQQGVSLVPCPEQENGLNLLWIAQYLSQLGVQSLFVEGGSKILTSFLRQKLYDRIIIFQGPLLIGKGMPSLGDLGIASLDEAVRPVKSKHFSLGRDLVWDLSFDNKNDIASSQEREPSKKITKKKTLMNTILANQVVFTGPKEVLVRSKKLRKVNENDVLMQSIFIGISHGTEKQIFEGNFDQSIFMDPLDSITDSTKQNSQDIYPLCYGYANLAQDIEGNQYFCFSPHQDIFYYPKTQAINVNEIHPLDAILFSHMETAVSIVQDAKVNLGDRVIIAGQGIIGLLVTELVIQSGASSVITLETSEYRRSKSNELSAKSYNPLDPEQLKELEEKSKVEPFDVVINCSANEQALALLAKLAPFESSIIEASWFGKNAVNLDLGASFHRNRLQLKMVQVSHIGKSLEPLWTKERRYELVKVLLNDIMPRKYVTHIFPLKAVSKAFELITTNSDHCLQCILDPNSEK